MRVVVTGGAGFIGNRVVARLVEQGYEPVVFDRSTGRDILIDAFPAADTMIHLAGVLGTSELFDDPETAVDINIRGTVRVLEACRRNGASYVGITMHHEFPSIYTACKIACERLADAYHHAYGIGVSHVRAYNAYGPGQKHGAGHPRKLIPTFAAAAWENKPLEVWGDGTQTVDLIHVDQLAWMLVDAVRITDGRVLEGGTATPIMVTDIAEFIVEATGSDSPIVYQPMRRGETPSLICADATGWRDLDWTPTFSWDDLRETVLSYEPSGVAHRGVRPVRHAERTAAANG